MAIEELILHMNEGVGETSYASNSLLQRTVISMIWVAQQAPTLSSWYQRSWIALKLPSEKSNHKLPSFQVFLNDLPGSDFNTVFRSLPSFCKKLEEEKGSKFKPCFIAGVPGSFYGRLFHNKSLHFVHSSYALMWLSEAPKAMGSKPELINKGNICVAKTSPPTVFKAYNQQFNRDFSMFLKSRAEELVPGGRMVLTTMASFSSDDPLSHLGICRIKAQRHGLRGVYYLGCPHLRTLGLIEEEKLDAFNLSYYAPTKEEVKKVIEEEGSFKLQRLETFAMDWDTYIRKANGSLDKQARAAVMATGIRAVGEPILSSQFGEAIMDDLFRRFKDDVVDYMETYKCKYINLVISLTKKS
ncbi:hypothetical protein Pint_20366 [Pistacia integerrima]|uniref:Uncharacterized protein n=1 Tax=Pistacia integerrima TaxID=434235 RepID=A0ACC0XC65_9ROSI|nr:hypothetical protein Pint_20366 [Pistacia integerrima]